jgi:hypothetical protein
MLDWPEGSVSASRQFPHDPWEFRFEADVRKDKMERQERNLSWRRRPGAQRRALFVWVFCVTGDYFSGWWTYLIGIGRKQYSAGGIKGNVTGDLMRQVQREFPTDCTALFGDAMTDALWMEAFAHQYRRRTRWGEPEGYAPVWAMVRDDRVVSIQKADRPKYSTVSA